MESATTTCTSGNDKVCRSLYQEEKNNISGNAIYKNNKD